MPRNKRRSHARSDVPPAAPGPDLPAAVSAECRQLAGTLIEVTSARCNAAESFAELHRITSKLSELQRDFTLRPTAEDGPGRLEAARRLLTEMVARGVDCSSVDVAAFEGQGLGLSAGRDVHAHDVVLEIPRALILTTEEAFSSPIGDFLRADPVCQGMPSMALAVFLLHEAGRGKQSSWAAYIASLPSAFTNCLYFSPADLQLLKGSPVQERVATEFRRICRQYAFFFLQLEKGKEADSLSFRGRFTFDDFRWAIGAVMSRNNPVPQTSQMGCTLGLIPLWDLGNHKFGEMTTDFDPESLVLRFHAMEDAAKDEQVLFHYGNRSNLDLLIYAGFAVSDNPFDRYPVRLGVSDKDPQCNKRLDLLDLLGLGASETFYLAAESKDQLPQPLLAFVRIFVMTEDELTAVADACPDLPLLSEAMLHPALGEKAQGVDERVAKFLQTRFKLLLMSLSRDWSKVEETALTPFIRVVVESDVALIKKALAVVEASLTAVADARQE